MGNRKIAVILVLMLLLTSSPMGWIFAEEEKEGEIITFQCPELEKLVRKTIGSNEESLIRKDVEKIRYLYQRQGNQKITSLQGIEALKNLQGIRIKYSSIRELEPLAALTELVIMDVSGEGTFDLEVVRNLHNLKELNLRAESLQNPEALAELKDLRLLTLGGEIQGDLSLIGEAKSLQGLDLSYQGIDNIKYLEELINLEYLLLFNNDLTEIDPLHNLINLREIYLMDNRIQSLSPLEKMSRLETAYLRINEIDDLRPLFDEEMKFRFQEMKSLDLEYNRIPEEQILEYEPLLKEHFGDEFALGPQNQDHSGYGFGYDYFAPTFPDENLEKAIRQSIEKPEGLLFYKDFGRIESISWELPEEGKEINSLIGIEHLSIDALNLSGNRIHDLTPLSFNRNFLELDLSSNAIEDISILFRDPNEEEPKLIFGNLEKLNLSNNRIPVEQQEKYAPYLEEHFGEPFDFGKQGNQDEEVFPPIFTDGNLDLAVRKALNHHEGELSEEDLAEIRLLQWGSQDPDEQIESLEGIDKLVNLKYLSLPHNRIEDLSPIEGMNHLDVLILNHNPISDFSPIGTLTNLKALELDHTDLEDTLALSGLHQMEAISLIANRVGAIDSMGVMPDLRLAWLGFNRIEDLEPLSELEKLEILWISDNEINDILPLFNEDKSLKNTNFKVLSLHHNRIPDEQVQKYKPVLDMFFQMDYYFGDQTGPGPVEYGRSPMVIYFSCEVLEKAVRDALQMESGMILHEDIAELDRVEWNGEVKEERIRSLQGIEDLPLTELILPNNEIDDLTDLTRQWQLKELDLRHNEIDDLSPLFKDPHTGETRFVLDHLEVLHLDGNRISTAQQEEYGPLLEVHFGEPFDFGVQDIDEPEVPVEPEMAGIEIVEEPEKIEYLAEEELELTGLVVNATYSDETSKAVEPTDLTVEGFDSSMPAENQVITVTYEGYSDTFTVRILAIEPITEVVKASTVEIGNTLSASELTGVFLDPRSDEEVEGSLQWKDDSQAITETFQEYQWIFTPASEIYGVVEGTVTVEGVPIPENSINAEVILTSQVWFDKVIERDLYIGPDAVLQIYGNVVVHGDIYVMGAMVSYGNISSHALRGRYFRVSTTAGTLYHGTTEIRGGSFNIPSITMSSHPIPKIPVNILDALVVNSDGIAEEFRGETLPIADLYIDGTAYQMDDQGRFFVNDHYVGYKTEIVVEMKDIFGAVHTKTFTIDEPNIPMLEDIVIDQLPNRQDYYVSRSFDPEGLIVKGKFSDGVQREIPFEELSLEGFNSEAPDDEQMITIGYKEFYETFTIRIHESGIPELLDIQAEAVYVGRTLAESLLEGKFKDPFTGDAVEGELKWLHPEEEVSDSREHPWIFIPAEPWYEEVKGTIEVEGIPLTVEIQLSAKPSEGGTVEGSGVYNVQDELTVKVLPNTGYLFKHWTENDEIVSTDPHYPFEVDRDRSLTAHFELKTYTVTFEDHDGKVLKSEIVKHGGSATPPKDPTRTGYHFEGWNTSYSSVTKDLTVKATYRVLTYTFQYNIEGEGGKIEARVDGKIISSGTTVDHGKTVSISAAISDRFRIYVWKVNNNEMSHRDETFNLITDRNRTLVLETLRIADLNEDGIVNITDLVMIRRHLAGLAPLEGKALEAADLNGDGVVNITDLVILRRRLAGLE